MTSKLKTHFKSFVMGLLIAALGTGAYVSAAVIFSDFTTGTTISSSEMNTKLNALKDAVNAPQVGQVFASPTACIRGNHGGDLHLDMGTSTPPANTFGPSIISTNTTASTSFNYFCPVPIQVPAGTTVTITGATMAFGDFSANCRVQAEVRFKTFGTASVGTIESIVHSGADALDFAATTGFAPATKAFSAFTLAVPADRIVWINATIAFNATGGGDCRYSGVLVDYTVSKP